MLPNSLIISHTLDVIEAMCDDHNYATMRLDGSTAVKSRQNLVDSFNRRDNPTGKVFSNIPEKILHSSCFLAI